MDVCSGSSPERINSLYRLNEVSLNIKLRVTCAAVFVGPCHHGMARPQVADGGTASDMEGSCE